MSNLRQAAQQALEALENHTAIKHPQQIHYCDSAIDALRAALAEEALQRLTSVSQEIEAAMAKPQRKPLTEEEIEQAYSYIWRNLPDDFDHTSIGWIEQGIRYAEQAHGIKTAQ